MVKKGSTDLILCQDLQNCVRNSGGVWNREQFFKNNTKVRFFMLEIELDLRKHCIETAAKRLHSRLISEYFRKKGDDAESEEKLVLVQKALICFDFSSLRTVRTELAGKSNARITLTDNGGSIPGICIDGCPVDTKHCIRKQNGS